MQQITELTFKIDTKHCGFDASSIEETKRVLRQIRSSADFNNSGIGYGIKVTINDVTHTIKTWLFDNNADKYLEIIGNPNSHFNKSKQTH